MRRKIRQLTVRGRNKKRKVEKRNKNSNILEGNLKLEKEAGELNHLSNQKKRK